MSTSKILAITNQKGGVGKTTIATSLAAALSRGKRRTLLIDCDAQCNSTDTYNAKVIEQVTLYDVLVDNLDIKNAVQTTEKGDIVACDPLLKEADIKLVGVGKEYKLKEALEGMKGKYDFIIIDTPPNLNIMLVNALVAATGLIIPVTPDRYSLQGLEQLTETIKQCQKYANKNLKIEGIVLNKFVAREQLSQSVLDDVPAIAKKMQTKLYKTKIKRTMEIRKAQAYQKTVFEYAQNGTFVKDINNLANEILED